MLRNGVPLKRFKAQKSLRQGDPLSHYLSSIAMEYLSECLGGLGVEHGFKFHTRCQRNKITHLLFVDDLLLFCYGDVNSV